MSRTDSVGIAYQLKSYFTFILCHAVERGSAVKQGDGSVRKGCEGATVNNFSEGVREKKIYLYVYLHAIHVTVQLYCVV